MRDAEDYILELIPAYALGCLDAEEVEVTGRHLTTCETCQAELAAYEAVADLLPLAVPDAEPSPILRNRLMTRIEASGIEDKKVAGPSARSQPGQTWWQQAAEALTRLISGPRWQPATALVILALVISNVLLWQRLNQPNSSAPGWQQIILTGTDAAPGATGIIYISANGRNGTLIVDRLPHLSPEQQYQLWLIRDGERISGGVFSVTADGYYSLHIDSPEPLEDYGAFGITVEPSGGSPGPTGERVLGYNL